MNEFTQLELNENLLSAIEKVGYEKPTPVQEQVIPIMLAGDDVFVQSQTGSGKTAAFVLPILNNLQPGHKKPQCLVMSPTRELAMQVASVFHELGEGSHFSILPIFGGQAYSRQISRLQKGVDVVVGTPGRMLDFPCSAPGAPSCDQRRAASPFEPMSLTRRRRRARDRR